MLLRNIFESMPDDKKMLEWFEENTDVVYGVLTPRVVDGRVSFYGSGVLNFHRDVAEIAYPVGRVDGGVRFTMNGSLKTLKNCPTACQAFVAGRQGIMEIDGDVVSDSRIDFGWNQIVSVEGIHRRLKCKSIAIYNNPIEGSILDVLKIPGLQKVETTAIAGSRNGSEEFHRALSVIKKHAGRGTQGVVRAQRDLIEAGLEAFA